MRPKTSKAEALGDRGGRAVQQAGDSCTDIPDIVASTAHVDSAAVPADIGALAGQGHGPSRDYVGQLKCIYDAVAASPFYNYAGPRVRVPSALNIEQWRRELAGFSDKLLPEFLAFGWPVNFDRSKTLRSTPQNHTSATALPQDLDYYIHTELEHGALAGPFRGPPTTETHLNPLMTRTKRDSIHRRVIMDLSWPPGEAVNHGIAVDFYIDGPATIRLPTVEFMEQRVLELGKGALMYKTDLARGYRQLRVDPSDWHLLGFSHRDLIYLDISPPFGLRTSALFMQRTSQAICYIHGKRGFYSRAYLDDFGGAERGEQRANAALDELQSIMAQLGVKEATHKVCRPATVLVWLGIIFDSLGMTMAIPPAKLAEVMDTLRQWAGRTRATRGEMQSLLGLLQFVASVSPPTRVFSNRMLDNLREMPKRGSESLSLGFKDDLDFFLRLLPRYNGVRILDKSDIQCQQHLELDACLSGCGGYSGSEYYTEEFPTPVSAAEHPIAHLELLNVVVAVKTWGACWAGQRVRVVCDNANACTAIQTGRSRDAFMQDCIRELFVECTTRDIELKAEHCPGRLMLRADALSRAHKSAAARDYIQNDLVLQEATRIHIPVGVFELRARV